MNVVILVSKATAICVAKTPKIEAGHLEHSRSWFDYTSFINPIISIGNNSLSAIPAPVFVKGGNKG